LCLCGEDEVDGVGLGFEARGEVVAVAGVFAVVDAVGWVLVGGGEDEKGLG